ncbi:MAG: hypothetical protein AAGN46_00290 [Acidobacteriota bacterium]
MTHRFQDSVENTFQDSSATRGRGARFTFTHVVVLVAFVAMSLLSALAVGAQPPEQDLDRWDRFAERFDADGNGAVTAAEIAAESRHFAFLDRNDDGAVTEDDFDALPPRASGLMLRAADVDRSRDISPEEWSAFLAELDVDGDGTVADDEIRALVESRRGDRRGPARPGRDGEADRPRPLDLDGNGATEIVELQMVYDQLDRNGDGSITADEMPPRRLRGGPHPRQRARFGARLLRLAEVDGDGAVQRSEWTAFLDAADADADGMLSGAELAAFADRELPDRPGAGERSVDVDRLAGLFDRVDADGDGVVTRDELRPRHRGRF